MFSYYCHRPTIILTFFVLALLLTGNLCRAVEEQVDPNLLDNGEGQSQKLKKLGRFLGRSLSQPEETLDNNNDQKDSKTTPNVASASANNNEQLSEPVAAPRTDQQPMSSSSPSNTPGSTGPASSTASIIANHNLIGWIVFTALITNH